MAKNDPQIPTSIDPQSGPIILLDMDGVCTNFVKGICLTVKKDYQQAIDSWPKGEYDLTRVLDIDPQMLWASIDAQGMAFWRNLESYPWFEQLYDSLVLLVDSRVIFTTVPSWSASSFAGKILWLQRRFGQQFRNYIFTPHKALFAHPNAILIDDSDRNIDVFNRVNQSGIIFPQPWNKGIRTENVVEQIVDSVQKLIDQM